MSAAGQTCSLGNVLAASGLSLVGQPDEAVLARSVASAAIWLPGEPAPEAPDVLIVHAGPLASADELMPLRSAGADGLRIVASRLALKRSSAPAGVILVDLGELNPAELVATVVRLTTPSTEDTVTRRLAAVQRSLGLALSDPSPEQALMARLKQTCNATVAVMDRGGQINQSTGPLPQSLLFGEIGSTAAESQIFDVDGWRGVAARLESADGATTGGGWLVVSARRPDFPDAYAISSVHVAANILEASRRMTFVARRQEMAVRATVLEQALALRAEKHDAELMGRMAGLGLSFDDELRVAVFRGPIQATGRARRVPERLGDLLELTFASADVPHLMSVRDAGVVVIVQQTVASLRRTVTADSRLPELQIGVGRAIEAVGDVSDSHNDAQLAVRHLSRGQSRSGLMSYEDFDFATRLFSDVGLDRMAVWADRYLAPLEDRSALFEGLQAYFQHDQNINAAADALSIHHNSLRYRLSKVEGLLKVNLKEPAAVASTFLALTALDLAQAADGRQARSHDVRLAASQMGAPTSATDFPEREPAELGVVYAPEG